MNAIGLVNASVKSEEQTILKQDVQFKCKYFVLGVLKVFFLTPVPAKL